LKTNKENQNKCALLFFGLPKCFDQAHESIKENIISYNPNCDVYLHTYNIKSLPSNKLNKEKDAVLNITEVYHLTNNVTMDTMQDFYAKHNLTYYRQFFPQDQGWLYPTSMDNMIKQWHSIESVWNYMDFFNENYTHVGLFRTDQLYKMPIEMSNYYNIDTDYIVRANYGLTNPKYKFFNDRLIIGTYNYTKIWASYRFSFVEDYLKINDPYVKKRGIHSETYLYFMMKSYIPDNSVLVNEEICAHRVRNQCNIRFDCFGDDEKRRRAQQRRMKRIQSLGQRQQTVRKNERHR